MFSLCAPCRIDFFRFVRIYVFSSRSRLYRRAANGNIVLSFFFFFISGQTFSIPIGQQEVIAKRKRAEMKSKKK